jgi:hypothetical protein
MTGPAVFETPESPELSHRARLILTILATIVLLLAVGVVEVGMLTAASVVSSSQNHGAGQ